MGKRLLMASVVLGISVCGGASGGRWYVDDSVSVSGDGQSWETAFRKIQEGINAASDGDTVIVAEGTYVENIRFNGKNIILTSTDPTQPKVVQNTIVDGNQAGCVVRFAGTENEACVLSGFTIRNGFVENTQGGGICGWTVEDFARATIENNVITGNWAKNGDGGGMAYCDGRIQNNIITGNSTEEIWEDGGCGGGLFRCNGTIRNNRITENWAELCGGGLSECDGMIENNLVAGNSAGYGAGLEHCCGVIQNCTISGNTAEWYAAGLDYCRGVVRNCIIWGNKGRDDSQLDEWTLPAHSCIQKWTGGGTGNINKDPGFVDAAGGDYHPLAQSPCIGAGANGYWFEWPQGDLDGKCRLFGERVDLGCYEYGASLDSDGDLLCDEDEVLAKTDPSAPDTDGDGLRDGPEMLRGSNPLAVTPPGVLRVPSEVPTIQEAFSISVKGDEVVVAVGTYYENLYFFGHDVILRSINPDNPAVVAATVMDGGAGVEPVLTLTGRESEGCAIAGFTIRNGRARCGAGICGGTWDNCSRATIRNNVITRNSTFGEFPSGCGGGLAYCDGLIENNVVTGNNSNGSAGGLGGCGGTIRNNVITGNSADYQSEGGGLCGCSGTIESNIIAGNSAVGRGGGLYGCDGTVQENMILGNLAEDSGGGLDLCSGVIQNNLVCWNSAGWGGALFKCDGTVQSNTIVNNWAQYEGGALYWCNGIIRNCIIWGNTGKEGYQIYESSVPSYSCIQDWTAGGVANVGNDPVFLDAAGGDYHLQPSSPCIDAGPYYYFFVWPQSDLDGNGRVVGERVDMGCYEYGASRDSDGDLYPDADEIATKTDPYLGDTDGDGLLDGLEILRGTDPLCSTAPGVLDVPSAFPMIQAALCLSLQGDEIVVASGVYYENIGFFGHDVTLRSCDPDNGETVASTIIDGGGEGAVVTFTGNESEACVLEGFTIRNGRAPYGGGICGGTRDNHTYATIRNNAISGNGAVGRWEGGGGGVAWCDGLIEGNRISGNSAERSGGGLLWCDGTIARNIIAGNRSDCGGGLAFCEGAIENNVIACNAASGTDSWDGGGGIYECNGSIRNNSIVFNEAAGQGGGLRRCDGEIHNCIIWGNTGSQGSNLWECSGPGFSCIEKWTAGADGNIAEDPKFVDPDGPDNNAETYEDNDYRLSGDSPCVDSGKNEEGMFEAVDLDGNPRIFYGKSSLTVDMGAYECGSFHFKVVGLVTQGGGEAELTWNSRDGDTYSVWSCVDLVQADWLEEVTVASGGKTTTWLDPSAAPARKFYRIEIK